MKDSPYKKNMQVDFFPGPYSELITILWTWIGLNYVSYERQSNSFHVTESNTAVKYSPPPHHHKYIFLERQGFL